MSKHEMMHKHVGSIHGDKGSANLIESAYDMCLRTSRACDVVVGGMIDGAINDVKQHPEELATQAWGQVKSGLIGKGVGLCLRACPPLALAAGGYGLYTFQQETAPMLQKMAPRLQNMWSQAYSENDTTKLHLYKNKVGAEFGEKTLHLGIGAGLAVVGFGAGLKTGGVLKSRIDGLAKSPEVLKELSNRNPLKALYAEKVLKQKPLGARVSTDEYGATRFYHPDKSYDVHYADGTKFHRSPGGFTSLRDKRGEVTREVPGVMRISDKTNGDRVYRYHHDGLVETHKPTGTVIKEHSNGVVETHRTNGYIYREYPDGTQDVIKKNASSSS